MIYCKNCGEELNDDVRFCTKCGGGIESDTFEAAVEPQKVEVEAVNFEAPVEPAANDFPQSVQNAPNGQFPPNNNVQMPPQGMPYGQNQVPPSGNGPINFGAPQGGQFYGNQQGNQQGGNTSATSAIVMSIIGIVCVIINFFGVPVIHLVGLVLGIVAMNSAKRLKAVHAPNASVAQGLAVVAIIGAIAVMVIGCAGAMIAMGSM